MTKICNVALGMIRDNPETARKLATYLENSRLNCGLEVHDPDGSSLRVSEQQQTFQ
jgi:hypothetical protein